MIGRERHKRGRNERVLVGEEAEKNRKRKVQEIKVLEGGSGKENTRRKPGARRRKKTVHTREG